LPNYNYVSSGGQSLGAAPQDLTNSQNSEKVQKHWTAVNIWRKTLSTVLEIFISQCRKQTKNILKTNMMLFFQLF